MKEVDVDKSGHIEFEEFLTLMADNLEVWHKRIFRQPSES